MNRVLSMQDLYIPLFDVDKSDLIQTNKKFWVGVLEGIFPSPPVPRRKTNCFTCYNVYLLGSEPVFICSDNVVYKIPKSEERFIQNEN